MYVHECTKLIYSPSQFSQVSNKILLAFDDSL